MKLSAAPSMSKPSRDDESLKRKLVLYRMSHSDPKVRLVASLQEVTSRGQ